MWIDPTIVKSTLTVLARTVWSITIKLAEYKELILEVCKSNNEFWFESWNLMYNVMLRGVGGGGGAGV